MRGFWLLMLLFLPAASALAITTVDDAGNRVRLTHPATRIVSLAPHATELLFAVGAGARIVGVDVSSDFPPAAQGLPRLGGLNPDLEALVALQPDLVVLWGSSSPPWLIERLRALGIPFYVSEPRRLDDIPSTAERFGELAGTVGVARRFALTWRRELARLREAARGQERVSVLYQILDDGLLTVSNAHLIGDIVDLCGGDNVFGETRSLVTRLDVESALARDPYVVVASGYESFWPHWQQRWRRYPGLRAVAGDRLYYISPDLLHRNGPRILAGAREVCAVLERSRATAP